MELLAVLVAVMVFKDERVSATPALESEKGSGIHGRMTLSGFTDNQGNPFVLDKMMTTAFPLSVILMELAVQLDLARLCLELGWVPREQNVEADALTNEEFEGFSEKNRIEVKMEELDFRVIPHLMEEAARLDKEIMATKEERKRNKEEQVRCIKKAKVNEKLRHREPW